MIKDGNKRARSVLRRRVKAAAEAARLFGEDVATALPTIEMIAREDLTVLAEAASAAVTA